MTRGHSCDALRWKPALRQAGCTLALVVSILASTVARTEDSTISPIPIAVADFDYTDTSGEVGDQQAVHEARLRTFARMIRADLVHDGRYRTIELVCSEPPCTAGASTPSDLVDSARGAGARLLLYGGIQKVSTLIQYAKVQVIDIEANKLTFDRLITFRSDTDESWQRAERFLARELLDKPLKVTSPE